MRVCIYCLANKPDEAFNVEHVIPQAFGTFEDNIVLNCVCTACNQYFGDTIDLKMARDSWEGIDRFWSGLKPTSEFKGLGRKSTTRVKFKDGAVQGGVGFIEPNPDGPDLRVKALPQFGLEQPPTIPTKWFLADELPEKRSLAGHGFDLSREVTIHAREMTAETFNALLEKKGFDPQPGGVFVYEPPPSEPIEVFTHGVIGQPEKRAATKIALNYLAFAVGPGIACMGQFDAVREFARYDRGLSRVNISENPWGFYRNGKERARGHYLSVHTSPGGFITAQVSLMLKLRYVVHLMTTPFFVTPPPIKSAHFFDIDTRVVKPIPVPRLVQAKQLPVAD